MRTGETLEIDSRQAFRTWLMQHHAVKREIWLIYFYKHTGRQKLSYEESVEEAICFGWIDGQVNQIDAERYVRRFSPRRGMSPWSEPNKQRALKALQEGMMTEAGMARLPQDVIDLWEENQTERHNHADLVSPGGE